MTETYESKFVWDFFINKGFSKYGVAGLMGNLYAESSIKANRLEALCVKRYAEQGISYTDETYTNAIDDGSISRSEFINPLGKHYGYGLAQWTSTSRKANLYDYCKAQKASISDLKVQCEYLLAELQTVFKTVFETLKTADDIDVASDIVLMRFEAPSQAESRKQIRRRYSQEIFDLYGGSKMVIIGSARIDENGNTHGGKAGDQTGSEVGIQEYYNHSKGWYVIRANSDTVRERIAQAMEWACANDYIGYDQYQRDTLYNAVKSLNFDISKLNKAVETDCSALVRVCVNYAGIGVGDFNTASELSTLIVTGAFKRVDVSLPAGLKRGDILVTKTKGHTVVALTNGDGSTNTSGTTEPTSGKYSIGWHKDDKGWWYADTVNTYLSKTWATIKHHRYYFDANGYMVTGWQNIDGKAYYFQEGEDCNLQGALWVSDTVGAQAAMYV